MQFFSVRQSLQFLGRFRQEFTCMDYRNVDSFIAVIISERFATYKELKEVYTLEEGFDLWEIIATNRYNENLAYEHAKKQGSK